MKIYVAVEGTTDEPVATRVVTAAGRQVERVFVLGGKGRVNANIPGYNAASVSQSWFVLRDLDRDDHGSCMTALLAKLLQHQRMSYGLALRFAVRETESWLLSDAPGFAQYFRVARRNVPRSPDTLADPKAALVKLCQLHSRSGSTRMAMCPRPNSRAVVGPQYTSLVRDFATNTWDPRVAEHTSPSLRRAIQQIRRLP